MANTIESGNTPKKSNTKKWFLISLGLLAAGTLSFFGITYFKKNKQKGRVKAADFAPPQTTIPKNKTTSQAPKKTAPTKLNPAVPKVSFANTAVPKAGAFPLRKGSRGSEVKALQQALINKHGKSSFPKNGADGIFGNEMQAALKKLNLPQTINQSFFNLLVQPKKYDARLVATLLNTAANKKEFNRTLVLLKTISDTNVYTEVNTFFRALFTDGVRQTLVNGLLSSFPNEEEKQTIRFEFARIGLKYDGKKWSLAGIGEGPTLITISPTKVWKDPSNCVEVPIKMVLGKEISKRGNFTLFENDRQYFLVETKHVGKYEA